MAENDLIPRKKRKQGERTKRDIYIPSEADLKWCLGQMTAREQEFVRLVLGGKTYKDAYIATADGPIKEGTAYTNSNNMAHRPLVERAIDLGRKENALTVIAGIAYDLKAAHEEVSRLVDEARAAGQFTAVANLMQHKLKLHGLLIDRAQIETTSLAINISGVDVSGLRTKPDIDGQAESSH